MWLVSFKRKREVMQHKLVLLILVVFMLVDEAFKDFLFWSNTSTHLYMSVIHFPHPIQKNEKGRKILVSFRNTSFVIIHHRLIQCNILLHTLSCYFEKNWEKVRKLLYIKSTQYTITTFSTNTILSTYPAGSLTNCCS